MLAGDAGSANAYAGGTFVNAGTLVLQKSITNAALGGGDVQVNGGTLKLAAANQIQDNALVAINGGTFGLGGFDETVRSVVVNSGLFESGSGVLTLTEATF